MYLLCQFQVACALIGCLLLGGGLGAQPASIGTFPYEPTNAEEASDFVANYGASPTQQGSSWQHGALWEPLQGSNGVSSLAWTLELLPGETHQADTVTWLHSPIFDLTGQSGLELRFELWMESVGAAMKLQASTDGGGTWSDVASPSLPYVTDFPLLATHFGGQQQGWSDAVYGGTTAHTCHVSLTPWLNNNEVTFRWCFASEESWYSPVIDSPRIVPVTGSVTYAGGFTALPQGRTINGQVTKTSGDPFVSASNMAVEFASGVGLSGTVVSVPNSNACTVDFTATRIAHVGPHSFVIRNTITSNIICQGTVVVHHPHQLIPARLLGSSQGPPQNAAIISHGVHAHNGEFQHTETFMELPGRRLPLAASGTHRTHLETLGWLGAGWTASFDQRLYLVNKDRLTLITGDGRIDSFDLTPSGAPNVGPYVRKGVFAEVMRDDNGTPANFLDDEFTLTYADGTVTTYKARHLDVAGQITYRISSMEDRFGNLLTYIYNAAGYVVEIRGDLYDSLEPSRHRLLISYTPHGRVNTITDFADYSAQASAIGSTYTGNRVWEFVYNSQAQLIAIKYPQTEDYFSDTQGTTFRARSAFTYDVNDRMLEAIDAEQANEPSPIGWLRNQYDASDRVEHQDVGRTSQSDTAHRYHINYGTLVSGQRNVNLVDPEGHRTEYLVQVSSGASPIGTLHHLKQYTSQWNSALVETGSKVRSGDLDYYQTSFEYDDEHNVIRIVHPRSNEDVFHYDVGNSSQRARGNLLRRASLPGAVGVQDLPAGQQNGLLRTFTYEPLFNQLETAVDSRAYDLPASYDIHLPSSPARDDSGQFTHTWTYDVNGLLTEYSSPEITSQMSPSAPYSGQQYTTGFAFNQQGQLEQIVDLSNYGATGQTGVDIMLEYGTSGFAKGRLVKRTIDPGGLSETIEYTYNSIGEVQTIKAPNGAITTVFHDQHNNPAKTLSPAISSLGGIQYEVFYEWNRDGNLVRKEVIDPILDASGQPTAQTRSIVTSWNYDMLGNEISSTSDVTDQKTRTRHFVYDRMFRLTEVHAPGGTKVAQTYDELHRPHIQYFGLGIADPYTNAIGKVEVDYDWNGNVAVVSDPRSTVGSPMVRTRTHDAFDRLRSTTDARVTPSVVYLEHDHSGNLVSLRTEGAKTDADQTGAPVSTLAEQRFFYDNMGRLYRRGHLAKDNAGANLTYLSHQNVTDDEPGWQMTTAHLLPDGRLLRQWGDALTGSDHQSSTALLTAEYNALGRLVKVVDAVGNERSWQYDAAGFVTGITEKPWSQYSDSHGLAVRSFSRDELGRAITTFISEGGQTSTNTTIRYDSFDRPVYERLHGMRIRHRVFDWAGRIVETSSRTTGGWGLSGNDVVTGQTQTFVSHFEYDDDDNLIKITEPGNRVTEMRYDLAGRTVQTILPSGKKYTAGSTDSTSPISGTEAYVAATGGIDSAGNVTAVNDLGGNVILRTYNAESLLTSVSVTTASSIVKGEQSASFAYDGLGRMLNSSNTDHALVSREQSFLWNTLSRTDRQTSSTNSVVDWDTLLSYDGDARKQQYTDALSGNRFELHFDDLGRTMAALRFNSSSAYTGGWSQTHIGFDRLVDASTSTSNNIHARSARRSDGRPQHVTTVNTISSAFGRQSRFDYSSNGCKLAVIHDDFRTESGDRVRGTRWLVDGMGNKPGIVEGATFPLWTGSSRAASWQMDERSTAMVSIWGPDGQEASRALFRGAKADLKDADCILQVGHNADGLPTSIGDIGIEYESASYPHMTADGVFEYRYDYLGRRVERRRISDGKVLEEVGYNARGIPRKHEFQDTPVSKFDFATSDLYRVNLPAPDLDWQGGGLRFTTQDYSHAEMYFPAQVRVPHPSGEMQGAHVSYHDFLISESGECRIVFTNWSPGDYQLQFRINGTSLEIHEWYQEFDDILLQFDTYTQQLGSTIALTSPPSGRKLSLGIQLDIGTSMDENHNVYVSIWSNGSQRLSSFQVQVQDFNFLPQGVQFASKQAGKRLYRYHSWVETQTPHENISPAAARSAVVEVPPFADARSFLISLDHPWFGTYLDELVQTGEIFNAVQEDYLQQAELVHVMHDIAVGTAHQLRKVDFSEISGYSDALSRIYSDGLRGGSRACQAGLIHHGDRIGELFRAWRERGSDISAARAIQRRLAQVAYSGDTLAGASQASIDVQGQSVAIDIPLIEGFSNCTPDHITLTLNGGGAGVFLGAFVPYTLDYDAFMIPRPYWNCPQNLDLLVVDGLGNYYVVRLYACIDFASEVWGASVSHLSQAQLEQKLAEAKYRTDVIRDQWLTEAAIAQARITELQMEIHSFQREMDSLAQQMAGRYSTFHGYFDHCVSVFDRESLCTVSDRILSEALLALGTMGAGTWASGTRAVALTPAHGVFALRHPLQAGRNVLYGSQAYLHNMRGVYLGAGEFGNASRLTGWSNPNAYQPIRALPPPKPRWTGQQINYKHGGPMSPIEHIFYRHGPSSGAGNAGKFSQGTQARDVVRMVREAGANGQWTWTPDGRASITYDFKRPIGTHIDGTPATKLKVYLNEAGEVMTAFPLR